MSSLSSSFPSAASAAAATTFGDAFGLAFGVVLGEAFFGAAFGEAFGVDFFVGFSSFASSSSGSVFLAASAAFRFLFFSFRSFHARGVTVSAMGVRRLFWWCRVWDKGRDTWSSVLP